MKSLSVIQDIYHLSFPELIFQAAETHRKHWDPKMIQFCTLDSIKTGACPEDCSYCPQSAKYNTELKVEPLKEVDRVIEGAREAKRNGSTRYCMGAAWREVRNGEQFDAVLKMVREVKNLNMEVCVTLGMLNEQQARELKKAGCDVYNHNLDTSRSFYEKIITTRSYDDRLATLDAVRNAGLEVCCGGILGMGESLDDRLQFLHELTKLSPAPESIPINQLIAVEGTPLEDAQPLPPLDLVRMIATSRILFPTTRVRLSAGRTNMSDELQALCFFVGANSIFTGDKLLTAPNPGQNHDRDLVQQLGMHIEKADLEC